MNQIESVERPERWAAALFAVVVVMIVSTPTGTPAALLHLATTGAALIAATFFTAVYFDRKDY